MNRVNKMRANYWIAKYVPDLFRNEPKNIGVFVQFNDTFSARFLGEDSDQRIDKRKLRSFRNADVYEQWVDYWRDLINKGDIDRLNSHTSGNYIIQNRGKVTNIDKDDNIQNVLNFLFTKLISETGPSDTFISSQARVAPEAEIIIPNLGETLEQTFTEVEYIKLLKNQTRYSSGGKDHIIYELCQVIERKNTVIHHLEAELIQAQEANKDN